MKYWVVGEFYDDTVRLLGGENGFAEEKLAQARIDEILAGQLKPHHVDYAILEAENLAELTKQGVLTMGYP